MPLLTIARVAVCVAVVEALAWLWPATPAGFAGKLVILAKLATLAIAFVASALVTRTVSMAELRGLRRGS